MPEELRLNRDGWLAWLGVLGLAVGLTCLFWSPMWSGGTLIGGDTISYYYPQKLYLAESLQRGELPLWNPLVGAGYPTVAESQTGVLYPPTLLLYRCLSVNAAYSANQILHYVIAFVGMWAAARRYQISHPGALLAGLVYVYGWFPARICLEWAIIGGAYLPWLVWIVERWLQSSRLRDLLLLVPVFGLLFLAGHFHMAFIATLGLGIYVTLRCLVPGRPATPDRATTVRSLELFGVVLAAGYLIAAVQLLPTAELKQRSQRLEFNHGNDPGYGHIPPWYLTQVASLWAWYGPDMDPDQSLFQVGAYSYPSNTNKVEAHLYFGMLPLALVLYCCVRGAYHREWPFHRDLMLWLIVGGAGLLLAIGWPYLVLKHLPGFGYFRGAGRNSVLTSLAMALAVGAAWDQFQRQRLQRSRAAHAIWSIIVGLTTWELLVVSHWITYAILLEGPLFQQIDLSVLRQDLNTATRPVRLWSPGANGITMLGHSSWPVYLGLGPAEYFDPTRMTTFSEDTDPRDPVAVGRHTQWLRDNGVTHVLSFDPLNVDLWPVRLVRADFDRMMSIAWARGNTPLYLYELIDAPGRIVTVPGGEAVPVTSYTERANSVSFEVDLTAPTTVELRDLAYPGWQVQIDGQPASAIVSDSIYRRVEVPQGPHRVEWVYQPRSLLWGGVLSGLTLAGWLLVWLQARGTAPSPPSRHSTQ